MEPNHPTLPPGPGPALSNRSRVRKAVVHVGFEEPASGNQTRRGKRPLPSTRGRPVLISLSFLRPFLALLSLCWVACSLAGTTQDRELVRDPHFQNGFYLLEPKPGKRVVYGEIKGLTQAKPVWDLAQWSSKFPLEPGACLSVSSTCACSNGAKGIVVGAPGVTTADLSLAVNAGAEYSRPRKSAGEPWVHLLVQQDFENPPTFGELGALNFHLEARLKRSVLVNSNDYSPSLHAAQYFVYFTVANRNPKAAGHSECFWFGIPIYDDRHRLVPAYEAQDFGETKLFIYTPASGPLPGGASTMETG